MDQNLNFFLKMKEEVSAATRRAGGGLKALGKDAGEAVKELKDFNREQGDVVRNANSMRRTMIGLGLGAVVGTMVRSGITAFAEFETALVKMQTLAGETAESVHTIGEEILQMGIEVGQRPVELAQAFQYIASSGFEGAEAMEILEASAQGAAIGLGTTKEVANVVTSAMNAYADAGLTAADATGILITAIKEGKAEPEEFGATMGRVLGIAKAAGLEFDELAATVATLSITGLPAAEAITGLRQVLQEFISQSPTGQKTLIQYGLSLEGIQKTLKEKGLLAALGELTSAIPQSELYKVISGVEGLNAVLALTGPLADKANGIFAAVANGGADDLATAFRTVAESSHFSLMQFKALINEGMIRLGQEVMPMVSAAIANLITLWRYFTADTLEANNRLTALKVVVGLVAGAMVAWATVMASIQLFTAIQGVGWLATAMYGLATGTWVSTEALVAFRTALITTGIGAIIVAIGALIAGLVYLGEKQYDFNGQWVKGWDVVVAAVKAAGAFLSSIWETITAPLRGFVENFQRGMEVISLAIRVMTNFVSEKLSVFGDVWDAVSGAVGSAAENLTTMASGYLNTLGVNVDTTQGKIAVALMLLRAPLIAVQVGFATMAAFIVEVFKNGSELVGQIAAGIGDVLKGLASAAVQFISGDFAGAWTALSAGIANSADNVVNASGIVADAMAVASTAGRAAFDEQVTAANDMAEGITRALDRGTAAFQRHIAATGQASREGSDSIAAAQAAQARREQAAAEAAARALLENNAPPVARPAGRAGRQSSEEKFSERLQDRLSDLRTEIALEEELATVGFESARAREVQIAQLEAANDLIRENSAATAEQIAAYSAAQGALAGAKFDTDQSQANLEMEHELRILQDQGPAYMQAAQMFGDAKAIRIAYLDAETAALQAGMTVEQARREAQNAADAQAQQSAIGQAERMAQHRRDLNEEVALATDMAAIRATNAREAYVEAAAVTAYHEALREGIVDVQAYVDAARESAGKLFDVERLSTFQSGVTAFMQDLVAQSLTTGEMVRQGLGSAFSEIGTALDKLFSGQKVSFAEMIANIARGIAIMLAKALIIKAILWGLDAMFPGAGKFLAYTMGMTGAASNAVPKTGSATGPIKGFANGGAFTNGIVDSPTMFAFANGGVPGLGVMGEAGPEAIMPLSRGANGKLGVRMEGGGGGQSNVFNMGDINVSYASSGDAKTDKQNIDQLTKVLGATVDEKIQRAFARATKEGGQLARPFAGMKS